LLALVPLGGAGRRGLRHLSAAAVAAAGDVGWGAAPESADGGGRRARGRGRDGARARTEGRPRQLVRPPVGGSEGYVSILTTEQTHGIGVAHEAHPFLGHLVPRRVRRSLRVRDGTPPLVGEGAGGARGGREGARARSLEGPRLLPSRTRPGLVPDEGTPAAGGVGSARVDQADSVLRDGDAAAGSDRGAEDVRVGASYSRPHGGRRGRGRDGGSLCHDEVVVMGGDAG
jgi:hypothetical protein